MSTAYTGEERDRVRAALDAGHTPSCPRCNQPFTVRAVPRDAGIPYVRHRAWLLCPGCNRSLMLDVGTGRNGVRSEG